MSDYETELDLQHDKPGRKLRVSVEEGMIVLAIDAGAGGSEWTWMSEEEAEAVAAMMAKAVEARRDQTGKL